jgi:hypothetical protein
MPKLRDSETFDSKRAAMQWGALRQTEFTAEAKAQKEGNFDLGKTLADARSGSVRLNSISRKISDTGLG